MLGKTGLKVRELGMGSEGFVGKSTELAHELIETALENGVNYFDLYNPEPYVRSNLGAAMKGRREKFIIQGHVCSAWIDGQAGRVWNCRSRGQDSVGKRCPPVSRAHRL